MVFVCCVPNCNQRNDIIRMHSFPKEPDILEQWLRLISRNDLLAMDCEKVRSNYRICDLHFANEHRVDQKFHSRTGLIYNAVPTLHLPGAVEIPVAENFSPHQRTSIAEAGPSTSAEPTTASDRPSLKRKLFSDLSEENKKVDRPLDRATSLNDDCAVTTPSCSTKGSHGTSGKRRKIKEKLNMLRAVNVTRAQQLTPKAKFMYKMARELKRTAAALDRENVTTKDRLRKALEYTKNKEFLKGKVNETTIRFITSQLDMQQRDARGRRFSIEDKVFALSVLKQSPKGYKLLRRVFTLPSKKTLVDLLNKIPFGCGLNQAILDSLKESTENMAELDKYCTLLFDEMSVDVALSYNIKEDTIEGFEDCGEQKSTTEFADHVMVFMARGIHKKWKQPIAYFYTQGGMKSTDLIRNIKQIVSALQQVGLKVVATVSDQLSTSVSAHSKLKEETNAWCLKRNIENKYIGYIINGEEVIHLYDSPHLLKGIRNNMVESDVKFKYLEENEQIASWKDIIALYELDEGPDDFKLCPRLSDQHVYEHKMKKMKVKLAAQVFSQRVSAILRFLGQKGVGLPPSAPATADFLLFVDKLFDSVNGSLVEPVKGKMLRCAIKKDSQHLKFWEEALKVLNSVAYLKKGKYVVPPTIINWIHSIRGLRHLWQKLETAGFRFLCPRNLNQDPLENFFGCIRSQAGRNINPTCSSFAASYKTLIVNNFTSTHSPGSNCQKDDSEGALNNLRKFLEKGDDDVEPIPEIEDELVEGEENFFPTGSASVLTTELHSYLAGYFAKRMLQIVKCKKCRENLVHGQIQQGGLTEARSYSSQTLLTTKPYFREIFTKSCEVLHFFLPMLCCRANLGKRLQEKLHKFVLNFLNWPCEIHNLIQKYSTMFVKLYILTWVRNINKILKGKEHKNLNDIIKEKAHVKYKAVKVKRKKVTEIKGLI